MDLHGARILVYPDEEGSDISIELPNGETLVAIMAEPGEPWEASFAKLRDYGFIEWVRNAVRASSE